MKKTLLLSCLSAFFLIQAQAQNCTSFSAGILQTTQTTCGLPNGSLAGSATGGVTPYTYLWSNGATAANLQNLSAGTYTLTVTASNGCTATASTTLSNIICPKVNTAATVSNITQNGATINWPAISCANKYRVVVKNVSTGVQTTTIASATTFNLSGLLPSTNYQVRIRTQCSQNGSVLSQFSPIASFTTLNSQGIQCLPPSIINPVGTTNTTATINWNAAAGAVQYNIRYRTTGTTAWTALVINGTQTTTTIQNLIPGTAYEYQIRTKCNSNPDEFSPYSAILSFSTTLVGVISNLGCADAVNNGTLTAGSAANSVSSVVPYTGGNGGTYSGQSVTSTGVTGLTATLVVGNFASGAGNLTYTIAGTPSASGTASFALNIGGQTCALSRTVNSFGQTGITAHTCGAPNVHNSAKTYGSMTDQQGNTYRTIVIGTQEWMAEHLNTSIYRNGDPITTGLSNSVWTNTTQGAWNHFVDDASYACPYGKLYNWYACVDSRQLCPTGWHVPSDDEWSTLINFIDPTANGGASTNTAADALKSSGIVFDTTGFWSATFSSSNSSGFSGIPIGYRNASGNYFNPGVNLFLWSSSQNNSDPSLAIVRSMINNSNSVTRNPNFGKRSGFAVRCIKDNSSYGAINSLECGTAVNSGTLNQGALAFSVSSVISYTGGNGGAYYTSATQSTGVTGLTATVLGGNFANGNGTLTYTITGTPSAGGNALFALNIGGKTCTLIREVIGQPVIGTHTCGANFIHNPALTYGTMTDQSGYTYKTIVINNKEWMAENLKTFRYRNGDMIPVVTSNSGWNLALLTGYSCFVQNDSVANNCPYGKIYNHYAVADARGICPTGWHVPDNSEWNSLIDALNNASNPNISGGKMKSTGTVEALDGIWKAPNTDATNSSGFSGIPGGYRDMFGSFVGIGFSGYWWSSQVGGTNAAGTYFLSYNNNTMSGNSFDRRAGCSVRCVKD